MKIIFLGTGKFAVPILEKIAADTNWKIVLVVTEPEKPAGRGAKLTKSPIHKKADELGLNIFTPKTLKETDVQKQILNKTPDIIITAAYGKIIPKEVFDKPKHKTINIHPSLLPKLRGPSPIQWALLDGMAKTGVSLMLIDEDLDHGPILSQEKASIDLNDTYNTLEPKLAELGAEMVIREVPRYVTGELAPTEQNHNEATYSKIIKKEDGHVDWSQSASGVYSRWRAFVRWPGTFSFAQKAGRKLRLNLILVSVHLETPFPLGNGVSKWLPGTLFVYQDSLLVQCEDSALEITKIQPEGKRPMTAKDFINGHQELLEKQLI